MDKEELQKLLEDTKDSLVNYEYWLNGDGDGGFDGADGVRQAITHSELIIKLIGQLLESK